jgi:DNA polymerase-3 subunit gamma/tau
MSYQVLARKYRPQTFSEVIGQEHITTTLKNALELGRMHHAYLFTGVRGVGKTTVARILAKALNCQRPEDNEPCGTCQACIEITEGRSLDVQEIDGASNTGVDDVREIRERTKYLPSSGKYKVYIIDEVHMLSTPAFNALLKTLEEPPSHVVFIFATTESHKIPATILSRCQRYDFRRIPAALTLSSLKRIATREGVTISPDAVEMIARESTGSLRDAQSLFDQAIAFSGEDISAESIKSMLGCLDRTLLFELIAATLARDANAALLALDKIFETGADLTRFAGDILEVLRHLLVLAECGRETASLDLPADEVEMLAKLIPTTNGPELHQMFSIWYGVSESVSRSPFPKMLLEVGLIRLSRIGRIKPIAEVIARLDALLEGGAATLSPATRHPVREISPPIPSTTEAPQAPVPTPQQPPQQHASLPSKGTGDGRLTFEPAPRSQADIASEKYWQEFMRWAVNEKPQAAAILQQATLESIAQHEVCVRFASQHYADMQAEQDRMQRVSELLTAFFKRPMHLKINAGPARTEQKDANAVARSKKDMIREALKDEIVSQAADILGAKLHDVKVEK